MQFVTITISMFRLAILTFVFSFYTKPVSAQIFQNRQLSEKDMQEGVTSAYYNHSFENYYDLSLYANGRFHFQYLSTNYRVISNGTWQVRGDTVFLNSDIDSNNVPVKLHFFSTDTLKTFGIIDSNHLTYSTRIQVPINRNQSFLPDSKVFINDYSTYCFPYFDTCVGNVELIKRIKVDFGDGYKTNWIDVHDKGFRRMLIIAQVDFLFGEYKAFRNHRLILKGSALETVD